MNAIFCCVSVYAVTKRIPIDNRIMKNGSLRTLFRAMLYPFSSLSTPFTTILLFFGTLYSSPSFKNFFMSQGTKIKATINEARILIIKVIDTSWSSFPTRLEIMVIGMNTTTVVRLEPNTDRPTLSVPLSMDWVTLYKAFPFFVA